MTNRAESSQDSAQQRKHYTQREETPTEGGEYCQLSI